MKNWLIAATLALSFTAVPAAFADKCACKKGHGKTWTKLGVSDEVKAKIEELHTARHAAKKEWKAQWTAKHQELHALLMADPLDQSKIDTLAAEMATLKGNKVKSKVEHKSKVAGLLTAEQRATVFKAKAHKKGKKGGKRDGQCSCGK